MFVFYIFPEYTKEKENFEDHTVEENHPFWDF